MFQHFPEFCLTVLFCLHCSSLEAAMNPSKGTYDIHGNYIPNTEHKKEIETNCCYIPSCDSNGCYDFVKCGYQCSQGNYQAARYSPTPGYKLLDQFKAYKCYFSNCGIFILTCDHCPDPNRPNFSMYTVRSDCRECYRKKD